MFISNINKNRAAVQMTHIQTAKYIATVGATSLAAWVGIYYATDAYVYIKNKQ